MSSHEQHYPPEGQDPHEVLENLSLMLNAQTERIAAEKLNVAVIAVAKEHDQPTDKRYTLYCPPDEGVPVGTDAVVEEPRPTEDPLWGVKRLVLRFPSRDDHECPQPPAGDWWNDVIIEVEHGESVTERYLINGKGMFAYETANDIAVDEKSHDENERDLFVVTDEALVAEPFKAGELSKIIAAYRIAQQTSHDY